MSLKPLECPNCHGRIDSFDETTKKGFCPFCDYVIVDVPERQSQFAVDAQGHVQVAGIAGTEEQYQRIKDFMHLGEKDRALALAQEFADKHPMDFRGWQLLCDLQLTDALEPHDPSATYPPAPYLKTRASLQACINHLAQLAQTPKEIDYLSNAKETILAGKSRAEKHIAENMDLEERIRLGYKAQKKKVDESRSRLNACESERLDLLTNNDFGTGCAIALFSAVVVLALGWSLLNTLSILVAAALALAIVGAFEISEKVRNSRTKRDLEFYSQALSEDETELELRQNSVSEITILRKSNESLIDYAETLLKEISPVDIISF